MNKELQKNLEDNFSFMIKDNSHKGQQNEGSVGDPYRVYGVECDDGWYNLIFDLCTELTDYYNENKIPMNLHVEQIKEKYGGLRFYYYFDKDDSNTNGTSFNKHKLGKKVNEIVEKYCDKSLKVCEFCGKPGRLRENLPWLKTLCDECYDKKLKDNDKLNVIV